MTEDDNGSRRRPLPKDLPAAIRELYAERHRADHEEKLRIEGERRIARMLDDAEGIGVSGDRAFGRPALSGARAVAKRLGAAIADLADAAEKDGIGAARLKAATDILPDLDLLSVGPPAGPIQAQRRDLVRRFFTHPALFSLIAEKRPGRQYAVTLLAERLSADFTGPTLRRVFDKSAEIHEDVGTGRGG